MKLPIWKINNPWPYFYRIEREVFEISEYIHFDTHNENCYGERLAKLIIVIGSEIDTNLRVMTGGDKKSNMRTWKQWLSRWNPAIVNIYIDNSLNFRNSNTPFGDLELNKTFEWWNAYNEIKHNRHQNFNLATISTLTDITAALFVVNMYATYTDPQSFQCSSASKIFYNSMPWELQSLGAEILPLEFGKMTKGKYLENVYPKDNAVFPIERYFNLHFCL